MHLCGIQIYTEILHLELGNELKDAFGLRYSSQQNNRNDAMMGFTIRNESGERNGMRNIRKRTIPPALNACELRDLRVVKHRRNLSHFE